MQPKYVTQSQLPFVLYVMKPTTSHPHPSPLLHTSLTITQICNPIEFFVSHLISLNTFVYLVSLKLEVPEVGINGKQTIYIKGVLKYKKN